MPFIIWMVLLCSAGRQSQTRSIQKCAILTRFLSWLFFKIVVQHRFGVRLYMQCWIDVARALAALVVQRFGCEV